MSSQSIGKVVLHNFRQVCLHNVKQECPSFISFAFYASLFQFQKESIEASGKASGSVAYHRHNVPQLASFYRLLKALVHDEDWDAFRDTMKRRGV